jgi:hypothetical protein
MIVAFKHPHNEGIVAGLITGPGFDTKGMLVDTYEVDASIRSFDSIEDAKAWLAEDDIDMASADEVPGGMLLMESS